MHILLSDTWTLEKKESGFEGYALRASAAKRKSFTPRPLSEPLGTWLRALPGPWTLIPGASCPTGSCRPTHSPVLPWARVDWTTDTKIIATKKPEGVVGFWRLQSSLQTQDLALFSGYSENFLSVEMEFSRTTKGGKWWQRRKTRHQGSGSPVAREEQPLMSRQENVKVEMYLLPSGGMSHACDIWQKEPGSRKDRTPSKLLT